LVPELNHNIDRGTMHLHWLTLNFTGPNAFLEVPFRAHYVLHTLWQVRIALFLGAVMYGFFGVLDAIVLPLHKHITWSIRYLFVCPAILAVSAATFYPRLHKILQPLMSLLISAGGLGIILMIIVAPPPINYYYYAGLILVFMFGYSFIYLRFLWASLSGWIIVALYMLVVFHLPFPTLEIVSNSFFLVSANIAGMLVSYTIEYASRRNYFLLYLLAKEQQKIREINELLELRVMERTAELREINCQLSREIAERHQAEQERNQLESQLKQAEKLEAIGKLAAGVAHDLNNVLSGIVTYPDFLLINIDEKDRLYKPMKTIQQSGLKAAAIVQDLLSLTRQGIAEKTVANLNDIVEDYINSPEYGDALRHHPHVEARIDLQENLLNVYGASLNISKALMNVFNNALEAINKHGRVEIATRNVYLDRHVDAYERIAQGEYAVLSITDTGVGISEDDQRRIFEPFFTRKKLGRSGTGLGMTLVWSTVKDHDGYIDMTSSEGEGTALHIYFPATRQGKNSVPAGTPSSLEDYRGREKVLVVDDIEEQRTIAASMLGMLGYSVHTVDGGEAALAYLKEETADIVVLDMIMEPGIDGLETYQRMLAINPSQKAVIASGFSASERVRKAQELGAGSFIRKPYVLQEIAAAIRKELDREPNRSGS